MIAGTIVETSLAWFTRAVEGYRLGVETVRRNAAAETRYWQQINDLKLGVNSLEITLEVQPRATGKGGPDVDREKCEAALRAARIKLDSALKNWSDMEAAIKENRTTVIDAYVGLKRGLDDLEATFRASGGLDAALSRIQELREQLMGVRLE